MNIFKKYKGETPNNRQEGKEINDDVKGYTSER